MSTIKGQGIKVTTWSNVREKFNYPKDDNNGGYEFGFEFVDEDLDAELDSQWFETETEMYTYINGNELKIQIEVVQICY